MVKGEKIMSKRRSYFHYIDANDIFKLGCLGFLVLILIISSVIPSLGNQKTFTATVTKTYVDGGNTFFVLQKNDGSAPQPYENEDNIFFWKFNSGDFLVGLTVGQTYEFHTCPNCQNTIQ